MVSVDLPECTEPLLRATMSNVVERKLVGLPVNGWKGLANFSLFERCVACRVQEETHQVPFASRITMS